MRGRAVVLAVAIAMMAPLGAWGADLVVCCLNGCHAPGDEALREIVAAFEQGIDKGLDRRSMASENDVTKAIVDVRDAARRLSSSVRSYQARVSSGRDDTNSKTFFDYKAAARLKEAKNALDRLTTTKALQERGYTLEEIKLIQRASLHRSSGGKRAQERAKQARAELDMLGRSCGAEDAQRPPELSRAGAALLPPRVLMSGLMGAGVRQRRFGPAHDPPRSPLPDPGAGASPRQRYTLALPVSRRLAISARPALGVAPLGPTCPGATWPAVRNVPVVTAIGDGNFFAATVTPADDCRLQIEGLGESKAREYRPVQRAPRCF